MSKQMNMETSMINQLLDSSLFGEVEAGQLQKIDQILNSHCILIRMVY